MSASAEYFLSLVQWVAVFTVHYVVLFFQTHSALFCGWVEGGCSVNDFPFQVIVNTPRLNCSLIFLNFRFLDADEVVEVDQGRPAEIRCNVDATPLTNSTLKWKRADYDFGK